MTPRKPGVDRPWVSWLAALVVGSLVALPIVAMVLPRRLLTPDAIEHLLIAHQWVNGSGFVVPVQWHHYLAPGPPHPAIWSRAPVISLFAALPLALGASVSGVMLLHALLAGVVAGLVVWVAARLMALPFAIAIGLLLGFSGDYQHLGHFIWTEVAAVGVFVSVVATSARVARGPRAAALCALLTWVGWLTRPNLGALLLAVAAAVTLSLGPRRALRHAGLWSYVLLTGVLVLATWIAVQAATSLPPYAGYGVVTEYFHWSEVHAYRKQFVGTLPFVWEHLDEVLVQSRLHAIQLFSVLFLNPFFSFPGWLALFGLYAVLRPKHRSVEVGVLCFSLVGFSIIVLGLYGGFPANRYAILVIVAAMLLGGLGLDALSADLASRQPHRWLARAVRAAPLVLLGGLIAASTAQAVPRALRALEAYREHGTTRFDHSPAARAVAALCPAFPADTLVAASQPWMVALFCGNATLLYPVDLTDQHWQDRFLDEERPGVIITHRRQDKLVLAGSTRLRLIGRAGDFVAWRVTGVPGLDWSPAPPLACAGRPDACRAKLGRP